MIHKILGTAVSAIFVFMMHFPPAQWAIVATMLLVVLIRDGLGHIYGIFRS